MAVWAALAFGGDAFAPWTGSGFEHARVREVSESEIYPDGRPDYDLGLSLTLVELDGTNWTEARVLSHVRRTAAIFGTCGIALDDVTYAKARAPGGEHDIDFTRLHRNAPLPEQVVEMSELVPHEAPWPVVFFVGRLLGDDAYARSYRRGEVPVEELPSYPYMNTVWISFRTHWMERKEKAYSTLAHELGHVLCECGHKPDREHYHLLNEYRNFLGPEVLPEHCAMFRASPLVRPLHKPSGVAGAAQTRAKQFVSPR